MPMPRLGAEALQDLPHALEAEWLETNGLGGYASSTAVLANTRAYHGLLVAALQNPRGRYVLLSRIEAVVHWGGRTYFLSTNHYAGGSVVHPEGYQHLTLFTRGLFPTFTYRLSSPEATLELGCEIFLLQGQNSVAVVYTLKNLPPGDEVRLELRPLIAYRYFHRIAHRNDQLYRPIETPQPGCVRISPYYGMPPLELHHNAASVEATGYWYDQIHYPQEMARGLPSREDLFNHCQLLYTLRAPGEAYVVATLEAGASFPATSALRRQEIAHRETLGLTELDLPIRRALITAAQQFYFQSAGQAGLIAGFPWHTDRGRDSMICVPGLLFLPQGAEQAKALLQSALQRLSGGLLPSEISETTGAPVYDSFDASLWLFEAIWLYVQRTGDKEFVSRHAYDRLAEVIDHFIKGTTHGIRMDPQDFLLTGGGQGLQLTWMEASVGGEAVTPRSGKPVEVQALWYNALRILERLAEELGIAARETSSYSELAKKVRKSFSQRYWLADKEILADCIDQAGNVDASMRPNQLFSFSLSFPVLEKIHQQKVLSKVHAELWTAYGLRTLGPGDPKYQGRYAGGIAERDRAYHQGTIWTWLLGPYYNAYFRVHGRRKETIEQVERQLEPLHQFIRRKSLGLVPELFDGNPPHAARGAIAHAMATLELLRIQHQYLTPRSVPTR